MNVVVKASLILAGAVAVLSVLVFVTGFHKSFMASQIVFLVGAIVLNVGIVVWALGETASENTYGQQLLSSAGIGLLGGALVVLVSLTLLTTIFPNALEETRQGAIAYMDSANMPKDRYAEQMKVLEATTPWSQSFPGGVGTFFTSVVTGAIFAIFKRKK